MSIFLNYLRKGPIFHNFKSSIFYRHLSEKCIVNGELSTCKNLLFVQLQKNHRRFLSQTQNNHANENKGSIVSKSSSESSEVSTSLKETVKETTKTASYSLVIILGIGVTAALFYAIFRELFSSKSPNSVYTKAFEKCIQDPRIQDALGEPIKGHGETTKRGRRRHVSHLTYMKDNVEHMRMHFYLKGTRKTGTVHLEVIEGASGKYEYRYLFMQMDEWPNKAIVLEDNRQDRSALASYSKTPLDLDPSPTISL